MSILPQLIANSIIAGALYTLLALGFNLIFSTVRFFDLGYGAMTTVGGYVVFYIFKLHGFGLIPSILAGLVVAGLIGLLANQLIYKKLRARKASSMVFLVASLGVLTVVQAIVAILFTSQFQTLSGTSSTIFGSHVFEFGGAVITDVQLTMLIVGAVIMTVLGIFLKMTMLGKAIKAVSDDEEVSKIVGINTEKIIALVMFLGAAIAGLAGILVGFDTGIEPTMGMSLLLKGVIASIIGGVGNVYGGVIGAFVLGFVENFGIWKISGEWKDAIAFGVLILFLLFRPQGIWKKK